MCRDNESPIDPIYEPESAETRERLAGIERRLKRARPRPVKLDGFELERLEHATPLRSQVEISGSQRRRYRTAALLTGSWVCGMLVGAVVVFAVMRSGVSGTDSTTMMAQSEQGDTSSAKSVQTSETSESRSDEPNTADELSDLDAAVLALATPGGPSSYWRGETSLCAGMVLPRLVADPQCGPASTSVSLERTETPEPFIVAPGPYRTSSPEITREELMRDLLRESTDFLL